MSIRVLIARCLCGCQQWVCVDVVRHEAIGTCRDSWDAARIASALNRHSCPPNGEAVVCDGCGLPVVTMADAA